MCGLCQLAQRYVHLNVGDKLSEVKERQPIDKGVVTFNETLDL